MSSINGFPINLSTLLNNSSNQSVSGTFTNTNTTESNTISTGSIITSGGLGVGKSITAGVSGSSHTFTGTATFPGIVNFTNTTANTNTTTSGAVIISGGLGVAGTVTAANILSTTNIVSSGNITALSGSTISCLSNIESTSTTTGSIQSFGGIGVGKSIVAGASTSNHIFNGTFNLSTTTTTNVIAGQLSITNTTAAIAYNIASVTLAGGLGVTGSTYFNSPIHTKGAYRNIVLVTATGTYTVTSTDEVIETATNGAITVTYPAASSNTGRVLTVVKVDGSGILATITINSTGGNVQGTNSLTTQYAKVTHISDGTNWTPIG